MRESSPRKGASPGRRCCLPSSKDGRRKTRHGPPVGVPTRTRPLGRCADPHGALGLPSGWKFGECPSVWAPSLSLVRNKFSLRPATEADTQGVTRVVNGSPV